MPNDGRDVLREEGPWLGQIEPPAKCGPNAFESAFNVTLKNGEIEKRKGRLQLNGLFTCTPAMIAMDTSDGAGNLVDFRVVTEQLTISPDTGQDLIPLSTNWNHLVSNTIYVGCPFPFGTITLSLLELDPKVASALQFTYWTGQNLLVLQNPVHDGTSVAGSTLAQSGSVVLFNGAPPSTWLPEEPVVNGRRLPKMYYIRLTTTTNPTHFQGFYGVNIEMTADAWDGAHVQQWGTALTTAINGIVYMQLPSGERQILVGMDDQLNGQPRLFAYQYNGVAPISWFASNNGFPSQTRGVFKTISLPSSAKTGIGAFWRGIPYGGKLILTNGYGDLLVYDGVTAERLNALWGADSATGTRTYGPAPTARLLAVFDSALYAAGIIGAPRSVQVSETQNAYSVFTGSEAEQVGGANYWPVGNDFDVSTADTTRPETSEITGIAVLAGRTLITTRERAYLYSDLPYLQPLGSNTGCIASGSLATIGEVAFYLGDRTVWQVGADGSIQQIGLPLDLTLRTAFNMSAIRNATAVISVADHEYRLYVPLAGDDRNRACFVYDYLNQTWATRGALPPLAPNTLVGTGDTMTVQGGELVITGSTNPFDQLDTFFVASAARVNEIGEPEVIFTGDYSGHLFIEDEGDSDCVLATAMSADYNVNPILAYVVTHRMLRDTTYLKLPREFRVEARKEGAPILGVLMLPDGEDAVGAMFSAMIEGRFWNEAILQTLSGDSVVPQNEAESWFGMGGTQDAIHTSNIGATPPQTWATREFRSFKYSCQTVSGNRSPRTVRSVQFVIFSFEAQSPFSIRAWELDYTGFPEARR